MQSADEEEILRIYQAARLGKTKVVKEALEAGKITADYADAKVCREMRSVSVRENRLDCEGLRLNKRIADRVTCRAVPPRRQ